MTKTRLGNLVQIIGGGTPTRDNPEYWGGRIPWITVKDFGDKIDIRSSQEWITSAGLESSSANLIDAENVILVTRMALGSVAINKIPVAINQDLKALICSEKLLSKYLLFFLLSKKNYFEYIGSGATVKGITLDAVRDLLIPLPPLEEQKRIAAILEEADHARRTRRFTQSISDRFLQEVFVEMFGDPQADWSRVRIESLVTNMRTGPFGSQLLHSEFVNEGIAVLGIDNAVQNRFVWDELRYITEEKYQKLKRYTVYPDDVLITIMGTTGRCAIVPKNIPLSINTKHLCCITLVQDKCLPIYLKSAFLYHPEILQQLGVFQRGAIMDGLNMGIIKNLLLPLPPISLQKEYGDLVIEQEQALEQQTESERQTEHLFQTLLHQAFRGEL